MSTPQTPGELRVMAAEQEEIRSHLHPIRDIDQRLIHANAAAELRERAAELERQECECGHSKALHNGGHGSCAHQLYGCECVKFTPAQPTQPREQAEITVGSRVHSFRPDDDTGHYCARCAEERESELHLSPRPDATVGKEMTAWPFGDATVWRCGDSVIHRKDWPGDAIHAGPGVATAGRPTAEEMPMQYRQLEQESREVYASTGKTPRQLVEEVEELTDWRSEADGKLLECGKAIGDLGEEIARLKEEVDKERKRSDQHSVDREAAEKQRNALSAHVAALTKERDALAEELQFKGDMAKLLQKERDAAQEERDEAKALLEKWSSRFSDDDADALPILETRAFLEPATGEQA